MPSAADPPPSWSIDRLVAGGDGFLRTDEGLACFVPGAFPGDRIRPLEEERRKRLVKVTAFDLLDPSPHRIEPACPVADRCGGCDWMALDRPTQLLWKGRILQECLRRQGGVDVEVGPARSVGPALGYRHRVRFQRQGGRLGFFARRSRDLVPVDACAVAHPNINAALAGLRGDGAVDLRVGSDGASPTTPLTGRREAGAVELRVGSDGASPLADQRLELPGAWVDVPPGAFSQVNPHVNRALVQAVLDGAGAATSAFDLHCGAGNFALPLAAAGLAVNGCDIGAEGLRAARASAVAQGLSAEFFEGSAERALRRWSGHPDLVVLDPPRAGCRELIAPLLALRPPRIAMVSCDPATCARDVGALVAGGYGVESATAWDMFPQTHHVEALVWMVAP